ncbi:MAG: D-alanyl-D-alanine carboxypeptidase/D-alanyl-D-alanine-endopeptidase [Longimonas sp.]|uniref:D-alanyl-D-alanine carboxypeptidase/D-alanyl-D-alanine endopeptidase n=1 Tax=Longimonas sp. TaxID=2039626 RepID=UPI00335C1BB4
MLALRTLSLGCLITLLVLVTGSPLPGGAQPLTSSPSSALSSEIDRILDAHWGSTPAFWGIHVVDLENGNTLYAHHADHRLIPASTQKLLTTAAALDQLGSSYRYETELHFNGTTEGAVMRGDLTLRGSGDPTFGSTEIWQRDPLQEWAQKLAEQGVERIEGRLIGDARRFDGTAYPESWDIGYVTRQASRYIGTASSALSYSDNVVALRIQAAAPGQPPDIRPYPNGALTLNNEATTSSRWRGNALHLDRAFESNTIRLHGSVARSYRGTVNVPVTTPTDFAMRSLVLALEEAGIETDLTRVDADTLSTVPDRGSLLFVSLSPPLADIVAVINKRSNNFYAEQLLRTIGWGGSVEGGENRIRQFLRQAGVARPPAIHDGSGLSRRNLVTPKTLTGLLQHMENHPESEAFRASLAGSGERNTTMEYRLSRYNVEAKTGSLRYVRALSGYVTRTDGSRVAFTIMANNYSGGAYRVRRTMDEIVQTLTDAPVL